MANLTGSKQIFHGNTTIADTSAQAPLGTRAFDANGGEWVYLRGTASVIAGSWCTFNVNVSTAAQTKLVDADDVGPLAIAGTAVLDGEYGWFQVYGKNALACNTGAVAAASAVFLTSTAGYVDDADVAGDMIVGATSLAASSGSAFTVWLNFPYVCNDAIN